MNNLTSIDKTDRQTKREDAYYEFHNSAPAARKARKYYDAPSPAAKPTPDKNTIQKMDPMVVFPEVEKMIYKLAWKTAEAYPVTFEEARSEAYWAFMRSCEDFKPGRGAKFSSWCYYWVWTHLKTFVTKRTVDPLTFVDIDDDLCGGAAPLRNDCLELVSDLSEDAKEMISLFLETPAELVGVSMTPHQYMKRVKKMMVTKGRDRKAVETAFLTLQSRFQEVWA